MAFRAARAHGQRCLHKASEIYGEYKKKITGLDLRLLGAPDGAKLLLFPVEDIRPGETIVDLTVLSDVEEASATSPVAGRPEGAG